MGWNKTADVAVKTGEYVKDGQTKGRYENVGHVLSDGKEKMLLLKRTFNPAGVPNPDGRDTVILSVFPIKDDAQQQAPARRAAPPPQDDSGIDEIPF